MNLITSKPCITRTASHINRAIKKALDLYEARGFNITAINGDNAFNTKILRAQLLLIWTQIYGKGEHFGIIESIIRVIKERARCMCHDIPYQYHTRIMIKSLISCVVKWLNGFQTKGGISKTMSPSMIVEGEPDTNFNQERIVFGSYDLVYTGTSNGMNRRSIPSIELNKSKDNGGHYFMTI